MVQINILKSKFQNLRKTFYGLGILCSCGILILFFQNCTNRKSDLLEIVPTGTNSPETSPTDSNKNPSPTPTPTPKPTSEAVPGKIITNTTGNKLYVGETGVQFTSIQAAIDLAEAGDTIIVKKKNNNIPYFENLLFKKSGTVDKFISLVTEDGAIIDGNHLSGVGITIDNISYVRVVGFEIQNYISTTASQVPIGISVKNGGAFIEILNNRIHNIEAQKNNTASGTDAHGIAVYGSPTNIVPIKNVLINGNEIYNCKLGSSESLVINGNIDGFEVSNNFIHDNDNIGIDAIGFEGNGPAGVDAQGLPLDSARNGLITSNRVENIDSLNNPQYNGQQSADGIYVDGGTHIIIEQNKINNCNIGIEAASEHLGLATKNILIRNNFVSNSVQANIMAGGYASNRGNAINIFVINNTTFNGKGGELALQFNWSNIIVKNNLFLNNLNQAYLQLWGASRNTGTNPTSATFLNNLYYGSSSNSAGDFTDGGGYFIDPQLVDIVSSPLDLHLKINSPAIEKGVATGAISPFDLLSGDKDIDGQARILGSKIDIGADENK